jgi:hypothetical protein
LFVQLVIDDGVIDEGPPVIEPPRAPPPPADNGQPLNDADREKLARIGLWGKKKLVMHGLSMTV